MSKLNLVLAGFLALAVIAGVILMISNRGLRHDLGITGRDLKKSNRQLEVSRDSTQELEALVDVLKMSMTHKVIQLRDSLKQKSNESARWQKEYVKAKTTRIDRAIPNPKLDSAITRFLTGDIDR